MHFFIIISAIAYIGYRQVKSFKANQRRIASLKTIFSKFSLKVTTFYIPEKRIQTISASIILKDEELYSSPVDANEVPVKLIIIRSECSEELRKIVIAIDNYLLRNHNAAGDFNLMKDVVERSCTKMEDEIEAELPIPLYLGLMGTMIGIIVGIFSIAFTGGGFSAFVDNPSDSIGRLMGGVALAMIASFLGILLTTWGTLNNKSSRVNFENEKNSFYNWLQTELLPSVSETVASTLGLLQRNLTKFNSAFSENVDRMDNTLGSAVVSLSDQTALLQALNDIDVAKFATANVAVLKQLKESFKEFDTFNAYVSSVNRCMTRIEKTTMSIEQLYERTHALQEVADFFKKESGAIDERKKLLEETAQNINESLKESLEEIAKTSQKGLEDMAIQMSSLAQKCNEQIGQMNSEMETALQKFNSLTSTITSLQQELNQMGSVKSAILKQESAVNDLVMTVRQFHHAVASTPLGRSMEDTNDGGGISLMMTILKVLAFIMGLLLFLKFYFNIDFVAILS